MSSAISSLRHGGRHLAESIVGLVPATTAARLLDVWLSSLAAQEPRRALRVAFDADERLWKTIDALALLYDGRGLHVKHRLTRYHDFFVSRIAPGERVLDVGCGVGAVAHSMAAEAGAIVTGVDIDAHSIDLARTRYQCDGLEFVVGDATVAVPDRHYDTAVLSNVLEHIEDRVTFLRMLAIHTGAKRLLIRVPMYDRHWAVPLKAELGLGTYSDPGHYVEYTEATFYDEMAAAGMQPLLVIVRWGEIWAEASLLDPTADSVTRGSSAVRHAERGGGTLHDA